MGERNEINDAWMRFHDEHAQRLWRWIARMMGGSGQDVGDVVQETFMAAARNSRSYDIRKGSCWGWLWGIARRQMALHWRRNGKPKPDVSWSDLPSGVPLPDEEAAGRETALRVRKILMEMDDEDAFLLAGKYFDAMTTRQLAEALGVSEHAAESKLVRARQAFKEKFASGTGNLNTGGIP